MKSGKACRRSVDAPRLLRDKTAITRLLILAELERDAGATLSEVAQRLGVTVQAVSVYAKALEADGLLGPDDDARVTPKGLQVLHEGVRQLRGALDAVATPLSVIRVTSAIATAPVKEGERVGLFMTGGELTARPRARASSTGRATHDARAGDELVVGDLSGLVDLDAGRIHVIGVPSPAEGGSRKVDFPRLRGVLKDAQRPAKIGAVGTGATVLARRFGDVDFEFAAERAAFNAAERGLDVRLFVTRDRLPQVMQAFDQLNGGTLRRVSVELVDAPEVSE